MAATINDIKRWLAQGEAKGATHVIVVCDTYDHEDYPVFVMPGENARKKGDECRGDMQRVMECYSLALGIPEQLREHRAQHWDQPDADPVQDAKEGD